LCKWECDKKIKIIFKALNNGKDTINEKAKEGRNNPGRTSDKRFLKNTQWSGGC